jgi:hypothetical protein
MGTYQVKPDPGDSIMNRCRMLISAAVLFLLLAGCGDAQAQWPGAWGWGGQGWYLAPRVDQLARHVPYYALFPPVYYSHPVRWPYGCSPLARLPGVCADFGEIAGIARVEPLTIRNPFVSQPELAAEPVRQSSATPLVVRNPYVDQPSEAPLEGNLPSGSSPVAQLSVPAIATPPR